MKDYLKIYFLRPHHGMCLAFFIGEGYSDDFTQNMARMLTLLETGAEVELTAQCDEICEACPNKKGSEKAGGGKENAAICISEEKVRAYDRAVLKACDLTEGEKISFAEFAARVQEKIIASGKRKLICADCRWNNICSSTRSRWEKPRAGTDRQ